MAKQPGPFFINGTLGDVTFYKREGEWLARKKTSLNKNRVSTDPAFANSRSANIQFASAVKLAKRVYPQLPAEKKQKGVFGKMSGMAVTLMKQGSSATYIKNLLLTHFG